MAERYWPGATPDAAGDMIERLRDSCRQLAADGIPLRYLGATFVPADESVNCRFDGTAQAVRAAHELAGTSFDRLVVVHEILSDSADVQ